MANTYKVQINQNIASQTDLVSFILWAYNQEQYIRDALQGALSQTYSPLEIIISDDCSTDRTFEIIRAEVAKYEGPHTVVVNRNERNLGIGSHVNQMVARARGALIVCAAGDDISLPQRVEKIMEVWKLHDRKPMSIYSSLILIDQNGTDIGIKQYQDGFMFDDLRNRVRSKVPVEGASHAFSTQLFKLFGPLPSNAVNEDVILQMRAALTYGVATMALPLVRYRKHVGSVNYFNSETSASFAEKQTVMCERSLVCLRQFAKDIEKGKEFLPGGSAIDLSVMEDARMELSHYQHLIVLRKSVYSSGCTLRSLLRRSPAYLSKGMSFKDLMSYCLWIISPPLFILVQRLRA